MYVRRNTKKTQFELQKQILAEANVIIYFHDFSQDLFRSLVKIGDLISQHRVFFSDQEK